jgi:hypothetical protein
MYFYKSLANNRRKTQVALEFAYRRELSGGCSVFWVHADNQTTFTQDFKTIARKLDLPDDLDGEKLLFAVCDQIEGQPRWLLVLDNADDLGVFGVGQVKTSAESLNLDKYIPRGMTGMVLWTSRDERISTLVGAQRCIQVGRMSTDEAKSLLRTSRNCEFGSKEEGDARKLLEELHWLPLAISQASAYMRRFSMSIQDYLSRLSEERERWRVLKVTDFDRYRRRDVPNSVLETWSISIERIRQENELAYTMLQVIAYISNQNIPIEILAAVGTLADEGPQQGSVESQDMVIEAITRLKEFSFP